MNLLRSLIGFKLPLLYALKLIINNDNIEETSEFIRESLPHQGSNFTLGTNENITNSIDITYYLPALLASSKRIRKLLILSNFKINGHQMSQIIRAFRHISIITFESGDLDTEGLRLNSIPFSNLTCLSFQSSGAKLFTNWEQNLSGFENVISSLSCSNMKNSLKNICISWCDINQKKVQSLIDSYGLADITATDNPISWDQ